MTSSQTLLLVAVLVAVVPMIALGPRPPDSAGDLEKCVVLGAVTLAIGIALFSQTHGIGFFSLAHIAYLLAVVTAPALLMGWFALAAIRRRRTLLLRVGAVVGLGLAGVGVWGTHIEPNWLQTDRVELVAPVQAPITIGVLADLQTPNVGDHEWRAVNTLVEQRPDLVLVPGDFFQGPPSQITAETPNFVALLEALGANGALVAVVSGDSDFVGQLQPMVDRAGAMMIDNTIRDITVNGQAIRLAGVSVGDAGGRRLSTLAGLQEPSEAMTILLAHRPDAVFDLPAGADVDLIVAGHTHGGQVALPVFGPPVTFSSVPRSLAGGGLEIVDGYPIYVSAGVGLERLDAPQVRIGVRPEVGIINVLPG